MPALTLTNLAQYAAQAALLIGALGLTLAALRPAPGFRLVACRALLLVLLLLPLQVLLFGAPTSLVAPGGPLAGAALAVDRADVHAGRGFPWAAVVVGILALGSIARGVWLGVGLLRLRGLARTVTDAAPGSDDTGVEAEIEALQIELGTAATVRFVDRVAQPVTFGIAPAIVLLPASLLAAPADRRRAVVCHELLHVQRRDWLWVLGEELALTVLWFHPAAWWLIGELQLAREEVVDQLTVAATGARREYMDALLSAADLPSAPPLLSGFLRRRHLARRLVSLAEEVTMSRLRLASGGALMAAVLVGSGAAAVAAWPLTPMPSAGPQPDGQMLFKVRDTGGVRVVHSVDVQVPAALQAADFGEVVIDVEAEVAGDGSVSAAKAATVSLRGRPSSAAPGPAGAALDAAMAAAADAVREWRFEAPAETPASVIVQVRIDGESRRSTITRVSPRSGYKVPKVLQVGGMIKAPTKILNVAPEYPQEAQDAKVQGVVILEVLVDEAGAVKDATVLKGIPMLDDAAIKAVSQWRYEPTLLNGVPTTMRMTVTVNFTLSDDAAR